MTVEIAIPLAVAGGVAAALTPLVARLAERLEIVDRPTERSVSHRPGIPLLGGLAVAAGFGAGVFAALQFVDLTVAWRHVGGMLLGALVVLAFGVFDDRFGMGAGLKFSGQIAAGCIAIGAGFRLGHLTDPFTHTTYFLPEPLVWGASLLWIVGVTNAMNLIDGLDGLATGVGAIICATLSVILAQTGLVFGLCVGLALLGGLLGFLPYNFPPARIFLGDTGSLFLGYALALLSLEGYRQVTVVPFIVPMLALAIPILDTALSIVRRARTGHSPFRADRAHMHHRLLARRGSTRAAVLQFYFLTACFSLIAVSFTNLHGLLAAGCLVAVLILTVRLLSNLGLLTFSTTDDLAVPERPEEERT